MFANVDKITEMQPTRCYHIKLQVIGIHHMKHSTTLIAQDLFGNQAKLSIVESKKNKRLKLQIGKTYKFKYCQLQESSWITVHYPDRAFKQIQLNQQMRISKLKDIPKLQTNQKQKYMNVILFVVKINDSIFVKNGKGKIKNMIRLNCYDNGELVDVCLWDWAKQLNIKDIENKWFVFTALKFSNSFSTFSSTVYSNMQICTQIPESPPYSSTQQYFNHSSIYQPRTLQQIDQISYTECDAKHPKYSIVVAQIEDIQQFIYDGCKFCAKKWHQGQQNCFCQQLRAPGTKQYRILKVLLKDEKQNEMMISAFDSQIQQKIENYTVEQQFYRFYIKSYTKQNTFYVNHFIKRVKD